MYIQSGELVTILKVRIKNKFLRSLRFRMLAVILIVGMLPVMFMKYALLQSYSDELVEQKIERIQSQSVIIRDNLIKEGYDKNNISDSISNELSQFSSMYDGRVILINQDYKIVKDTYVMDEGKISISENVIKCFNGQNISTYNSDNNYIELTLAIKNSDNKDIDSVMLITISTLDVKENIAVVTRKAVIIEIVMYLVIALVALYYSYFAIKPFKKFETKVEGMSAGFLDEKLDATGYTETEQLAEAFNHMLERMKKLDDSRQEFVSNVSHELKTPITSIKVLADSLLLQEEAPAELYREFLSDIVDEIDRENKIITDLLDLVKLDKTNAELHVTEININEMVELILKRLRPIAAKRNIELVLESFRPIIAEIDEVKLTIAISNLVENAIKYNVTDGWVRVSLNADHKYFYIKVADSGIGIPEDCAEHVFERFYRVDKTRSRETGGTGLGLAITKNAIAMHRGIIKIYSKEGEGTTFTVRIPLNHIA